MPWITTKLNDDFGLKCPTATISGYDTLQTCQAPGELLPCLDIHFGSDSKWLLLEWEGNPRAGLKVL